MLQNFWNLNFIGFTKQKYGHLILELLKNNFRNKQLISFKIAYCVSFKNYMNKDKKANWNHDRKYHSTLIIFYTLE